ncbi:MAG: hypothetical protein HY360_02195 [Verrucomicrobia bacterium]|nr:hypothetical protein [Verrucomicrobiota bacterium]
MFFHCDTNASHHIRCLLDEVFGEKALAYLCGLTIVPVQRNRGIDAILTANPGENPVLIRVQRRGESLGDAAEFLHNAGRSKQPATLVLVVTDSQQSADLFNILSPDILLVNSTAVELVERLADRGIGKLNR